MASAKSGRRRGKQHKFAGRNLGPARNRYWSDNRLQKRKVRNLIKHCGMGATEAFVYWTNARKGRVR